MLNNIGPMSYDHALTTEDLRKLREFQRSFSLPVEFKEGRMMILKISENEHALISYFTHVATIRDGVLYRHWYGWSATTARHIKEFCNRYGVIPPNKKEWLKMEAVPQKF